MPKKDDQTKDQAQPDLSGEGEGENQSASDQQPETEQPVDSSNSEQEAEQSTKSRKTKEPKPEHDEQPKEDEKQPEQQTAFELPELEYPTLLYICPGQHSANSATYDYVQVNDDESLKRQLDAGYSLTLPQAINRYFHPVRG